MNVLNELHNRLYSRLNEMRNRTYDRSNELHHSIYIGLNVLYGEMARFCFQNSYICIKQTSFLFEQLLPKQVST